MQTMYYKTSSFIQHTGNVVDLEEYRRKAALARESSSLQQDPGRLRQPGRGADDAGLCPAGYAVTAATISWVFC